MVNPKELGYEPLARSVWRGLPYVQVERYGLDRVLLEGTVDSITPVMMEQEEEEKEVEEEEKEVEEGGQEKGREVKLE